MLYTYNIIGGPYTVSLLYCCTNIKLQADCVQFRLYSKEEILKLSVVEIFNPAAFNQLGKFFSSTPLKKCHKPTYKYQWFKYQPVSSWQCLDPDPLDPPDFVYLDPDLQKYADLRIRIQGVSTKTGKNCKKKYFLLSKPKTKLLKKKIIKIS